MRVTVLSLAFAAMTALAPSWAMASDREIAQQIAQDIYASGQLSDYKVMVKYSDGTAYLKGEVQDADQLNTALELARQSPHVEHVVNMVTIGGQPSDAPVNVLRAGGPTATLAAAPQFSTRPSASPQRPAQVNPNHHLQMPQAPTPPGMNYPVAQVAATEAIPQPAPPTRNVAAMPVPARRTAQPLPIGRPIGQYAQQASHAQPGQFGAPVPAYMPQAPGQVAPVRYDQPHLPSHAWPSYAAYPNYAAVTYPKQYSATAWPYIGPFYPYPQVPLGWRKVTMEWDDGWWFLDFKQRRH